MNNLYKALEKIHAEEDLKQNTIQFLQKKIQEKGKPRQRFSFARYSVVIVSIALVAFFGAFSYSYFTPNSYIGLDVNPSIELSINCFERVIDAQSYNSEGEEVLAGISLQHMGYDEATVLIMDKITELGYWKENTLVSITIQTNNPNRENTMLTTIESGVNSHIEAHHTSGQVNVFSIDNKTLEHARDEGMSAAKYLAIMKLKELDPTATIEEHREHSVGEIQQIIDGHRSGHHDNDEICDSIDDSADEGSENEHHAMDIPNQNNETESYSSGHSNGNNCGHD